MRSAARPQPRLAHNFVKEPHGHYVEPAWCSQRLFAVENFGHKGDLILDPACGWGTILQSARAAGFRVIGHDIVDRVPKKDRRAIPFRRQDFLKLVIEDVHSIVCNPPFDHVEEFCRRACVIASHKVAMLCLLRRLPAARWLQELPLETVYLLTPRPSMPPGEYIANGNKPGGGTQDFVWLVFTNGPRRLGSPMMRWLHRDGDADGAMVDRYDQTTQRAGAF
jgi:hypothetical protein